jgi:hypothetical protein
MRNLFREFLDLIPEPPLQVGKALSSANGVVVIELPGGSRIQARGQASVGQNVFVRNGLVEGPAPNLPIELIDV